MSNPTVQGRCPACGGTTLFLGDGGYVTCSHVECPTPDAAALILADADPAHIVEIDASSFAVQHPLVERIEGALFECTLHEELAALDGPPARPGRYRLLADHWTPL